MNASYDLAWLDELPAEARAALLIEAQAELSRKKIADYRPYPKQRAFHRAGATHSERLFRAGNQLGKALKSDEPVLTPLGWVEIGNLKVGDEVIAGDGTVTQVNGVYPQGVVDLYRLTFDQGSSVVCCADHLWQVTLASHRYPTRVSHGITEENPNFGKQTVVSTAYLVERYRNSISPKQRVVIPHAGTVKFAHKPVSIDPYLLGVLLGDGCLRGGGVSFSTSDREIVESVRDVIGSGLELAQRQLYDWNIKSTEFSRSDVTGRFVSRHSLKTQLEELGLYGKYSYEKHVPQEYLFNSPETRLAILQGLIDTDGSVGRDGTIEFCSTSKQLADDVAFLVRSFGGKARINQRTTRYTNADGQRVPGRLSYRLWIRCPQVTVVRLTRKIKNLVRPVSTCDQHVLHRVDPAGKGEAVCISVAHPSRLYVTRDFIVTHNTIAGGAEWAMHATGRYPDGWDGAEFKKPVVLWAGSVTGESTRDNPQRILVGPPAVEELWGTGFIPKNAICGRDRAMGVANLLDNVQVRWGGGGDVQAGTSIIAFKAYEKGREKWQGPTVDGVWFDEEPPLDIYTEGLTRTNNGQRGQFAIITFTPLLGMSDVVMLFEEPGTIRL